MQRILAIAKHFIFKFQTAARHEELRCKGHPFLLLRRDTTYNTSNWDPLVNTLWSILWPLFKGADSLDFLPFPPS